MKNNREVCVLTGSAGFVGVHIVAYLLEKTDWELILIDRLDFSGTLSRINELVTTPEHKKRVKFVFHDLKAEINEFTSKSIGEVEYIIHLAANSSVIRSIEDPLSCIMDTVIGTTNLLNWSRKQTTLKKFINFSTDESFGAALIGVNHIENDPHKPSNPYAAAKAAQEDIGYSFFITYNLPVITTHTMNNFSILQHPEKLVPQVIKNVLSGTPQPIYAKLNATGQLEAVGSRFWLHTRNTASAVLFLLEKGSPGEAYNIIGFDELTNLEMAEKIADIIGKPLIYKFVDVYKVRNGHDVRYSLDGSKMRDMGWKPEISFDESLKQTVEWYLDPKNKNWL